MILTVTLDLTLDVALDLTRHLDRLVPHRGNRVRAGAQHVGGKGVNVSRVLHALGHDTVVTGLVGGDAGRAIRAELAAAGLADRMLTIPGDSRRTVAVVEEAEEEAAAQAAAAGDSGGSAGTGPEQDTGNPTILLEPGPVVGVEEWEQFVDHLDTLLPDAEAVVLSGSLPRGLPHDSYAHLLRLAHARGVPAVLDADGAALRAALAAGPALVTPTAAELTAATGLAEPLAAARALHAAGAGAVVAPLGADGLIAVTPQGDWHARAPERRAGAPTGAGDAAVAALALGLVAGTAWPELLAEAVALSAAALDAQLAGDLDPAVRRALRPLVDVRPLAVQESVPRQESFPRKESDPRQESSPRKESAPRREPDPRQESDPRQEPDRRQEPDPWKESDPCP
ncbi:PfkB family carbohydrate kinase [Kitasatospora sp. NPDC093550]|uniref:1-phosphofructokinase family hexose kinase n=1 Tax=Kitasatospora sp. NPDC093550 TaxID=3364089 RepID=UPI0037FCC851